MIAMGEAEDSELTLNRFRRLVGELMRGATARTVFQPWELEILLDIERCSVDRKRRLEILRQYQRAVERQMECGPGPPMRLSEFLVERERRCGMADPGRSRPSGRLDPLESRSAG
ncbi:MAG TPA: hypothetical protein VGF59_34730 [Bryobacteraceae bacterium]|jgi:hypothetical protein